VTLTQLTLFGGLIALASCDPVKASSRSPAPVKNDDDETATALPIESEGGTDLTSDTGTQTTTSSGVPLSLALEKDDVWSCRYIELYDIAGNLSIDGDHIHGTISYFSERGLPYEAEICEAEIEFSGQAYTGDCPECELTFSIDPAVVTHSDASTEDCSLRPQFSLVPTDGVEGLTLGLLDGVSSYSESRYGLDVTETRNYRELFTGYHHGDEFFRYPVYTYHYTVESFYDPSTGDAWEETRRSQFGQLQISEDQIAWSVYFGYGYPDTQMYRDGDCEVIAEQRGAPFASSLQESSTTDCLGRSMDVWQVEASAGDLLSITVDTVAADTAFDPVFQLIAPSGCVVSAADDSFACTFPPPRYSCPAVQLTAPESGAYRLLVWSMGSCASRLGDYAVHVHTE